MWGRGTDRFIQVCPQLKSPAQVGLFLPYTPASCLPERGGVERTVGPLTNTQQGPGPSQEHSKIFAKADIGALKGIDYEHD